MGIHNYYLGSVLPEHDQFNLLQSKRKSIENLVGKQRNAF